MVKTPEQKKPSSAWEQWGRGSPAAYTWWPSRSPRCPTSDSPTQSPWRCRCRWCSPLQRSGPSSGSNAISPAGWWYWEGAFKAQLPISCYLFRGFPTVHFCPLWLRKKTKIYFLFKPPRETKLFLYLNGDFSSHIAVCRALLYSRSKVQGLADYRKIDFLIFFLDPSILFVFT